MDIISKHKINFNFRHFISFKIILLFLIVTLLLIFCINGLIISDLEDTVFSTKEAELSAAASEYSTSLSVYGLDYTLDISQSYSKTNRRVIITDSEFHIIFDSFNRESLVGKTMFHPAITHALEGKNHFSSSRNSSEISSFASAPIATNNRIVGAVSVFETDTAFPEIFSSLETISLVLSAITLLLMLSATILTILFITRKIVFYAKTIKNSQKNDSMNAVSLKYTDEFHPILDEFNCISERFNYTQEMRQAFVSDASHELRTPLAAIRLLCESITQTDDIDPDTVREFMEDMILEVDRMSHTAEKLLVLSRLDNTTKSISAPLSLSEIVENMITALKPIAAKKDVTLIPYIDENCFILGDTEGVNQIIGNLIDNAIKYNTYGGTVKIYLYADNVQCTFITDDTGIGIAPEFRERVFERFYRIDKSREHDGRGGSGLGLSIVKRNVESLGGTITISDSISGGTRFTVVFPSLHSYEEV